MADLFNSPRVYLLLQESIPSVPDLDKLTVATLLGTGIVVLWRAYQQSLLRELSSRDKLVETVHLMRVKAEALDQLREEMKRRFDGLEARSSITFSGSSIPANSSGSRTNS